MMAMARISYDEQTAAAFKAVREVPREGLSEWREAVRRHLRPSQGMTLVDIGAGTGAFAAAFSDWFDLSSPRGRAVGRDAGSDPADAGHPGVRGKCERPTAARCIGRRGMALPCHSPHPRPGGRRARDPPRSPPRRPRPHPTGLPGQIRALGDPEARRDRTRPMVPGDRSGDRVPSLPSGTRARRSRPRDSTRTLFSRFVRPTRPASRTSSARWTPSATLTPRCAISLRTSSSAVKNVSVVPYDMPRTRRTRRPEATGLTSWFYADSTRAVPRYATRTRPKETR